MSAVIRNGEFIVPDGEGKVIHVPQYDEILEMARRRFEAYESTIDRLLARTKELEENLESKTYADEKMAKMRAEVEASREAMYRGFPISEEEWETIRAWQNKHLCEAHGVDDKNPFYGGAIGGTWTFKFVPTSIGVVGEVICNCGEHLTFQELS